MLKCGQYVVVILAHIVNQNHSVHNAAGVKR